MASLHMNRTDEISGRRWQDWIALILGAWLFITPWALGDAARAQSAPDAWIVGALIVIVSIWALSRQRNVAAEWINAILGLWLFITPFWMDGVQSERVDSWVVGAIIVILSLWSGSQKSMDAGVKA